MKQVAPTGSLSVRLPTLARSTAALYRPPNEVISTDDYEVAPITLTRSQSLRKTTSLLGRLCSVPLSLRPLQTVCTFSGGRISGRRRIFNAHLAKSLNQHIHVRPT